MSVICSHAVHQIPAKCLDSFTVFTICGKPVVLKVESLQLMQMGNVLHCYLLDFVVLASGDKTQTVNTMADVRLALVTHVFLGRITNTDVYYCLCVFVSAVV